MWGYLMIKTTGSGIEFDRMGEERDTQMDSESKKTKTPPRGVTRRSVLGGIGAAAAGVAATPFLGRSAWGQSKGPINISFWTFENPQQRPWIHKRIKQYMEKNPNVRVDFQYYTFGDLGKKLSVGFATGTAPEGFISQDWFMPVWLDKGLLAPLDLGLLGYNSMGEFNAAHADASVQSAISDGQVYGFPFTFYGYCNYLNANQFKEIGLNAEKDWPKTWDELGEIARRLTIKDGNKFVRQGFKYAMHAPTWTVIQYNPILIGHGGEWFDKDGKCALNNEAGIKAMKVRAAMVREYGAEDAADTIATNPLPQMDWLKERCSMFFCHPIPEPAITSQNPAMVKERYYRPVQYPGIESGKGFSTTYGFHFVVNKQAESSKQEVIQDMYKFIMSDILDLWNDVKPFTPARKGTWSADPAATKFPFAEEFIEARDKGVFLPRTLVFNELADALHRAVQNVVLNNGDIKASLDAAAADVDRAIAGYKRG